MRLLLLASLALGACAPDPADVAPDRADGLGGQIQETLRDIDPLDVETEGLAIRTDVPGDVLDAVQTEDGRLEMGVTDQVLYSRLSKPAQEDIARDLHASQDQDGLGGQIARAVTEAVEKSLATAIQVPVDDIRSLRAHDGRLTIQMRDGGRSPFDAAEVDGRRLLDSFSDADARRLADAFRRAAAHRR